MSKESQSQPVIGRASASLENVGTGLLEWTLNDNVCNTRIEGLARSLMTVCKVFYLHGWCGILHFTFSGECTYFKPKIYLIKNSQKYTETTPKIVIN